MTGDVASAVLDRIEKRIPWFGWFVCLCLAGTRAAGRWSKWQ